MSALAPAPAAAQGSFGTVLGANLEDKCFSDDPYARGICTGYIEAMLALAHDEITVPETRCLASRLLPLRNVAVRGWSEVVGILEWVDERIAAGDAPTESEQASIDAVRDLASAAQNRRDLLSQIRAGSAPPDHRLCLSSLDGGQR